MANWLFKTLRGRYHVIDRLKGLAENRTTWIVRQIAYRDLIRPGDVGYVWLHDAANDMLSGLVATAEVTHGVDLRSELPWELPYWDEAFRPTGHEREHLLLADFKRRIELIPRARIEDDMPSLRDMPALSVDHAYDMVVPLTECETRALAEMVQRCGWDLPNTTKTAS